MRKYDILSSIFWFLIGTYVCIHAYKMGVGNPELPGPGFVFYLAAILLCVLSITYLFLTVFSKSSKNEVQEKLWYGLKFQKIIIILIGMFIYIFIFKYLGFSISTFLLMILLYRIVEPRKWWAIILSALITVFVSHIIFVELLKIPFPRGVIGI